MYVSKKDLKTISELTAFVDGALESADGVDEDGNDIAEYWKDFSKRTLHLQDKMMCTSWRQDRIKKSMKQR